MSLGSALSVVGAVIAIGQFSSPVMAQDAPAENPVISLSLEPTSPHLTLRLRAAGAGAHAYACGGPCVLDVVPGRYELGVMEGQGAADWHSVDLSSSETIEVHPSHNRLLISGVALLATGAALVGVGTGALIYGAVSNLETMECDTACGGVSTHFLRVSLTGVGLGLVLAAVGGVLAYSASGPTIVEKTF